jgi:hypothetical protein
VTERGLYSQHPKNGGLFENWTGPFKPDKFVRFSNGIPISDFGNRTQIDLSKTGLVRFSDVDCIVCAYYYLVYPLPQY